MAKILVIEDDKEILAVVELILHEEGHDVEGSFYGNILDDINSIMPQLIILDDWLGKEKGSDLCIKLKSDPKTSLIPVVLFSAHNDSEELAQLIKADAFIRKPFDIDELIKVVNSLL